MEEAGASGTCVSVYLSESLGVKSDKRYVNGGGILYMKQ